MQRVDSIDDIVQLSQLLQFQRDELLKVLRSGGAAAQPQEICIDESLTPCVKHLLGEDLEKMKNLQLSDFRNEYSRYEAETPPKQVVYIVRANIPNMKTLARRVKADKLDDRHVSVRVVPRTNALIKSVLKDELQLPLGTPVESNGYIKSFENLECGLVPVEGDFLDMGVGDVFKEMALDGHSMSLSHIAEALMTFQVFYGEFGVVRGKGAHAQKVAEILKRLKTEQAGIPQDAQTPQVDALYLFDREVDPYTPLIVQTTYEGVLDEQQGIAFQRYEVDHDEVDGRSGEQLLSAGETILLTQEEDPVWKDVRGCAMQHIGTELRRILNDMKEQFDRREHMQQMTHRNVAEFKNYIKDTKFNLTRKKLVQKHMSIVKRLQKQDDLRRIIEFQDSLLQQEDETRCLDYIEELIYRNEDPSLVLRLLCLQSSFFHGILPNYYKNLQTILAQNYGFEILLILENLRRLELFRKKGRVIGQLAQIGRSVSALMKDVVEPDAGMAKNVSYPYRGYAPSLVKLSELLVSGKLEWNGASGFLRDLPGPTFGPADNPPETDSRPKTIMLFFVGGITYSEIAGLRLITELARARGEVSNTRILIATTKVINGKNFIQELYGTLT